MEKLLPGVELQRSKVSRLTENGRILKRSKRWHNRPPKPKPDQPVPSEIHRARPLIAYRLFHIVSSCSSFRGDSVYSEAYISFFLFFGLVTNPWCFRSPSFQAIIFIFPVHSLQLTTGKSPFFINHLDIASSERNKEKFCKKEEEKDEEE